MEWGPCFFTWLLFQNHFPTNDRGLTFARPPLWVPKARSKRWEGNSLPGIKIQNGTCSAFLINRSCHCRYPSIPRNIQVWLMTPNYVLRTTLTHKIGSSIGWIHAQSYWVDGTRMHLQTLNLFGKYITYNILGTKFLPNIQEISIGWYPYFSTGMRVVLLNVPSTWSLVLSPHWAPWKTKGCAHVHVPQRWLLVPTYHHTEMMQEPYRQRYLRLQENKQPTTKAILICQSGCYLGLGAGFTKNTLTLSMQFLRSCRCNLNHSSMTELLWLMVPSCLLQWSISKAIWIGTRNQWVCVDHTETWGMIAWFAIIAMLGLTTFHLKITGKIQIGQLLSTGIDHGQLMILLPCPGFHMMMLSLKRSWRAISFTFTSLVLDGMLWVVFLSYCFGWGFLITLGPPSTSMIVFPVHIQCLHYGAKHQKKHQGYVRSQRRFSIWNHWYRRLGAIQKDQTQCFYWNGCSLLWNFNCKILRYQGMISLSVKWCKFVTIVYWSKWSIITSFGWKETVRKNSILCSWQSSEDMLS